MDDSSYIKEFLEEINETLNRLDRQFVALEQNPSNKECLTEIFRDLHTIKGSCGLLGLNKLESITHSGENLLGKLRDGVLDLKPVMITNLLQMMDAVWKTVDSLKKSGQEGNVDYSILINTLVSLEKGELPPEQFANDKPYEECTEIDVPEAEVDSGNTIPDIIKNQSKKDESPESANIRVNVELLDSLMNLVGEVVLARNQFSRIINESNDSSILGTSQSLSRVATGLQETVMKARMQPIKNVWGKLPRMVRDLSMNCGNKIRLEMEGQESGLDKSLITAIQDPLMNIIRNSIIHGIETPEERREIGKPEEGVIQLRAKNQNGQIHIEVQDDGRGINFEEARSQAVNDKRITREQGESLSDRDCGKLLFMKGFSLTRHSLMKPTKGNGLSDTRALIEKIGGALDIEVHPEISTTLKIKIPLTLAIIPALIVSNGPNRFAIPQVNIKELIWLEEGQLLNQIEEITGSQFYRLRGNLLPLVHLNNILGIEPVEDRPDLNIVVLQADECQIGLVVEQIHNTEEVVVKSLENLVKDLNVFSGATILGDGKIVLILDVMGLTKSAMIISDKNSKSELIESVSKSQADDEAEESMLIVNLGNDHKMAIRLADVARLEELSRSDIELSGDVQVIQYRDEIMSLINIPEQFNKPFQVPEKIKVVVYIHEGKSIGLIVENILDIVQSAIDKKRQIKGSSLMGTIITNNSVVDTIHVENLIKKFFTSRKD